MISSGQKTTTMAAWEVSELCFTQILSTLDRRILKYQGNHIESRIIWKSYQI